MQKDELADGRPAPGGRAAGQGRHRRRGARRGCSSAAAGRPPRSTWSSPRTCSCGDSDPDCPREPVRLADCAAPRTAPRRRRPDQAVRRRRGPRRPELLGASPGWSPASSARTAPGKTTTLRCLLGLVTPTAGSATIGGRRYRDLERPQATVGAALEASDFHPGRSARAHLQVMALAGGLPSSRVEEMLAQVGPGRVRRPPGGRLLPRHAAAARAGAGPARRPAGADPRRAGERPRPGRDRLAAAVPADAGR